MFHLLQRQMSKSSGQEESTQSIQFRTQGTWPARPEIFPCPQRDEGLTLTNVCRRDSYSIRKFQWPTAVQPNRTQTRAPGQIFPPPVGGFPSGGGSRTGFFARPIGVGEAAEYNTCGKIVKQTCRTLALNLRWENVTRRR